MFTKEQIIFLTFASGCSNIAFNFTWAVYLGGRSSWIALAIGIILTIPFTLAILYFSKGYPKCSVFDIIRIKFGKFIYIIIVTINLAINIVLAVTILNFLAGSIKIYFLQLTPIWIIIIINIILAFLFVNNKILLFGRTVELLTIWYVINYFTGFSLSFFQQFDFKNIYPIFDTTLLKFGEAVFFSLCSSAEILLFVIVVGGHIPQTAGCKKSIIKGTLFWAFILPFAEFIMQGISGTELLLGTSSAGVEISRSIFFGDFLRGLEVFILVTYQLICIMRLSLYLYCAWTPIKKIFNKKYSVIILLLISSVIFVLSTRLDSYNKAFFISLFMEYYVVFPFVLVVIVFTFLGTLIIKRGRGSYEKE